MLRPGDWVPFDGGEHQVVGLAGASVRLRSTAGDADQVVLAGHLMASPDFAVVDGRPPPQVEPFGLLDALPEDMLASDADLDHRTIPGSRPTQRLLESCE